MNRRLFSCLLAIGAMGAAAGALAGPPTRAPDYVIVVTGDELLDGLYPDGHTSFLARTLRPMGFRCLRSMIVDDSTADIQQALREATAKAPLVIVTGGLGPTENDVTREALAEYTKIPLAEHADVLAEMERRFKQPRGQLRPNLRRQCLVPARGTYLKNSAGTAVGLVFELPSGVIVALPGPPRELQPMVLAELVPYLSRRYGTRPPSRSLALRFVGVGQSQISHVLDGHIHLPPEVIVSSQFEGSRVDFTFSLRDDTPKARALLDKLKQQILKELGDYVYADDATTLEEHVGRLLKTRGASLAVAEVGSGGSLAAGLSGTAASAAILTGAYVATSEEKLRRLLRVADDTWGRAATSGQRVTLLAEAAAGAGGSTWTVAVGAVQDRGAVRSVEVAVGRPGGRVETLQLSLRGTGELARTSLATQLLDQLRRRLR